MWEGNLLPIDWFQIKKLQSCGRTICYLLTDSKQKNNYNYVRGQFLPFDRFHSLTIITIMWEGNLLPFDRFNTKKIITTI